MRKEGREGSRRDERKKRRARKGGKGKEVGGATRKRGERGGEEEGRGGRGTIKYRTVYIYPMYCISVYLKFATRFFQLL